METYSSSHCPCCNDRASPTLSYIHMSIITHNTVSFTGVIKTNTNVDNQVMHMTRTLISDVRRVLEGIIIINEKSMPYIYILYIHLIVDINIFIFLKIYIK